jgi:hypothetical protein
MRCDTILNNLWAKALAKLHSCNIGATFTTTAQETFNGQLLTFTIYARVCSHYLPPHQAMISDVHLTDKAATLPRSDAVIRAGFVIG